MRTFGAFHQRPSTATILPRGLFELKAPPGHDPEIMGPPAAFVIGDHVLPDFVLIGQLLLGQSRLQPAAATARAGTIGPGPDLVDRQRTALDRHLV